MRRVLSLEKPKYNSWSEYSRLMNMQFSELKVFWKYIDTQSKNVLIQSARSSTEQGSKEWHRVKSTVNDYDVKGPMGSMDPTLPTDLKDLERKMLGGDNTLRESAGGRRTFTSGLKTSANKRRCTSRQNEQPSL